MTSSSNTKVIKDVILSDESTWKPWYNVIKASAEQYWRYFDPEDFHTFPEPFALVQPLPELLPVAGVPLATAGPSTRSTPAPGTVTETPAQQAARELRNKKQLEVFFKDHNLYNQQKRDWEKVAGAQSKLRDRIQSSVAQHNASMLDADLSVRQWLQTLKASTALPLATLQRSLKVEYQRFILVGYSD